MVNKQKNIDSVGIGMALIEANYGTCERKQVGAFLLSIENDVFTGHNQSPRGTPSCFDKGCIIEKDSRNVPHCVRTVHAEMDALLKAGQKANGATLYCSCMPCNYCLRHIIHAGVKRIVYFEDYNSRQNSYWIEQARELGVEIKQMMER